MRPFALMFLLFLFVPLLEIYLFIRVGALIGATPTILVVILTAVIGTLLLRHQGLSTWNRVNQALERGELPAIAMMEGMILLLGGALLLTPGFFTDVLGFLALIPPLRHSLVRAFLRRQQVIFESRQPPGGSGRRDDRAIEGEYWREDD
jgi:UPF0716 protein FxsA